MREVLQPSELQVQAEQQMQRLDAAAVHGDVQQGACEVGVLCRAAGQRGGGGRVVLQQLLQLHRPLLHQAVDGGHGPAVLHAGRRFGAVQRTDAVHPAVHGSGVGLRAGDAGHLLYL